MHGEMKIPTRFHNVHFCIKLLSYGSDMVSIRTRKRSIFMCYSVAGTHARAYCYSLLTVLQGTAQIGGILRTNTNTKFTVFSTRLEQKTHLTPTHARTNYALYYNLLIPVHSSRHNDRLLLAGLSVLFQKRVLEHRRKPCRKLRRYSNTGMVTKYDGRVGTGCISLTTRTNEVLL